jgi:hypothetical protein
MVKSLDDFISFRVEQFGLGYSPREAFEMMCRHVLKNGYDFESIRKRSFKMVLRPADEQVDEFVNRMILENDPNGPIFAMRTLRGYEFFGLFIEP